MCHVFTAKASDAKSIGQALVWKPVKQGCAVTPAIRRSILTKKDGVQQKGPPARANILYTSRYIY